MKNGYLLEINDIDAGLLIREGKSFAFLALSEQFRRLEGLTFSGVSDAERAAWRVYRQRPTRAEATHVPIEAADARSAVTYAAQMFGL